MNFYKQSLHSKKYTIIILEINQMLLGPYLEYKQLENA